MWREGEIVKGVEMLLVLMAMFDVLIVLVVSAV